ncbi:DUF2786 domain-containing protein [Speluncibacter jeojiensis]|uniref:DUF2786 domain-containing protein n=1 Tax=Speluncibacter jeojiensis TaxID=2710754 RepID=A0A9X4M065_9ACTN|nr:DUF2786 domain-containing protein [Corynebacteriales bacterium D3-21]
MTRTVDAESVGIGVEDLLLIDALRTLYEGGWQPADVLHVTRRSTDRSLTALAASAVVHEAALSRAEARAPREWVRQLHAVRDMARPGAEATTPHQRRALSLLWARLPRWVPLCATPSRWPAARSGAEDDEPGAVDPRVLGRIRGLLAKAESTDFPEEAETLTAKAQELMTRYAIGAALLAADPGSAGPKAGARRVHLENPYVGAKFHLLAVIGRANRVQAVFAPDVAIATIVGHRIDLEQVEMLFTSLLVQATRALQGAKGASGGLAGAAGHRTTAYRKAFYTGFADRIGERLQRADDRATAEAAAEAHLSVDDLLPALARRSAAVDAELTRLFPRTRTTRARPVDAEGWHAGRAAADDANLATGPRRIERG